MRKLFFIITALSALLASSCSDNAFQEMLFRTTDDPFQDVPVTDSLSLEHTVYLSWREDEGCDTFFLMRSYDQPNLDFTCVYEGTATEYVDADLPYGDRYVYRLDKTRGTKYFEGKAYAFGYSSDGRKDDWEDNDIDERATVLDYDRSCNLPCVQYWTENMKEIDCDWFCVEVPPRRTADINIKQDNLSDETNGSRTDLMMMIKGVTKGEAVKQNYSIPLKNSSYEAKKFYFKIYPVTTELFSESKTAIIEYTVSLNQIINYSW